MSCNSSRWAAFAFSTLNTKSSIQINGICHHLSVCVCVCVACRQGNSVHRMNESVVRIMNWLCTVVYSCSTTVQKYKNDCGVNHDN